MGNTIAARGHSSLVSIFSVSFFSPKLTDLRAFVEKLKKTVFVPLTESSLTRYPAWSRESTQWGNVRTVQEAVLLAAMWPRKCISRGPTVGPCFASMAVGVMNLLFANEETLAPGGYGTSPGPLGCWLANQQRSRCLSQMVKRVAGN